MHDLGFHLILDHPQHFSLLLRCVAQILQTVHSLRQVIHRIDQLLLGRDLGFQAAANGFDQSNNLLVTLLNLLQLCVTTSTGSAQFLPPLRRLSRHGTRIGVDAMDLILRDFGLGILVKRLVVFFCHGTFSL